MESGVRKARTRAGKAEKKTAKAAENAVQAVLDTEKKTNRRKRARKTDIIFP